MKEVFPKLKFEAISQNELAAILFKSIQDIPSETLSLYPTLKDITTSKNSSNSLLERIFDFLSLTYTKDVYTFSKKAKEYEKIWETISSPFEITIANYFDYTWKATFEEIIVKVGLLPICPRSIEKRKFYITSDLSEPWIKSIIAHEYCHFIFFEKWKELHKDWSYNDFHKPSSLWYLSEIIIDPVLNSNNIAPILRNKAYSYDKFYDIKINQTSLMDIVRKIYEENSINTAIEKSYKLINDNYNLFL